MHSAPLVALAGLPNSGKSTLINKLTGNMSAVTSPIAGTTRDRQYLEITWNGLDFILVDTAGVSLDVENELEQNVSAQIDIAIKEADIIVLVIDGKLPKGGLDQKTLLKFRKLQKPLILAVNKIDSPKQITNAESEFMDLGIKPTVAVSALTGRGTGDLLDTITGQLDSLPKKSSPEQAPHGIAVSIVGKPNVGKSSLFNHIVNEERVVVSSIPGTTRTAIDSFVTYKGGAYTFIDTAGLKRKEHRSLLPDIYAGFQTFKAARRSDIVLFVIDALEPITKQDQKIASSIMELGKGMIILVNKFDLYQGQEQTLRDYISRFFPFLWMMPAFFVSAKTGEGVHEALDAIKPIYERRQKTISDSELQSLLKKRLSEHPPIRLRDQKEPKIYTLSQINTNPPHFLLTVNHPAAISSQFQKGLHNAIITECDFWGTPIKLTVSKKAM